MKVSSFFSKCISTLALAALLSAPSFLLAGEHAVGGGATYIVVDSETTSLPDGNIALTQTSKTILVCDDELVPFHLAPQTAIGTTVVDPDGKVLSGNGYAYAVDSDGDVMYIWWQVIEGGSEWGFMSGSGKYAGMTGGGKSKTITMHPDGSQVIRWDGELKMKE